MASSFPRPSLSRVLSFAPRMLRTGLADIFTPVRKIGRQKISIDPNELRIWYIGHASTLINFYGTTILTDPVLTKWLPFPRRIVAPGIARRDLPSIDYIIVSHPHFDHFSTKSLRWLASPTTTLIIPKNSADLVRGLHFKTVREMHWQETLVFDELEVQAYHPEHWGQRVPWEKMERGYNSYVLTKNNRSIFFCGDSGYGTFFKEIGQAQAAAHHTLLAALMPIGAYEPRDFMKSHHMNPQETVQAFQDLKAQNLIPIHWGNFRLSLEPLDEPVRLLEETAAAEGVSERIQVLYNGESWALGA